MLPILPTAVTLKAGVRWHLADGVCAMEFAAMIATGEFRSILHLDVLPACMSRTLGAYVIALNDWMPDDERQRLIPYTYRMAGTRGTDAEEIARAEHLILYAARPATAGALRQAGLHDHASLVAAAETLRDFGAIARDAADASDAALAAAAAISRATTKNATVAAAAAAVAVAYAVRDASLDWAIALAALDGALAIGPQAPPVETAAIERAVALLREPA